ncbi:hypothetical protein E2R62_12820 [Citrobacter rodentium]|uniref:Uncharacterized protein n=1 Tax=Citrobacter rodentium TaxID=67825 RepID=A0A482PHY4_CITRO|nr:hypothetical protein E2R62_12820 [Citrobacter rodentium]
MKLVNCTSTSRKRGKRDKTYLMMINQPLARSLIYFSSGRKKARILHCIKPDGNETPYPVCVSGPATITLPGIIP